MKLDISAMTTQNVKAQARVLFHCCLDGSCDDSSALMLAKKECPAKSCSYVEF